MLNVEQVRLLEERVQRVISRTGELQRENGELRQHLEGYQERIKELEARLEEFVSNQAEIEQGVLNALHRLDEVEDAVIEGGQEDRVVVEQELPSDTNDDTDVVTDAQVHADTASHEEVAPHEATQSLESDPSPAYGTADPRDGEERNQRDAHEGADGLGDADVSDRIDGLGDADVPDRTDGPDDASHRENTDTSDDTDLPHPETEEESGPELDIF